LLLQQGITSLEDLSECAVDILTSLPGIDQEGAALIKERAAELVAVKAAEEEEKARLEAEEEARLRAEAEIAAAERGEAEPGVEEGGTPTPPSGPAAGSLE